MTAAKKFLENFIFKEQKEFCIKNKD